MPLLKIPSYFTRRKSRDSKHSISNKTAKTKTKTKLKSFLSKLDPMSNSMNILEIAKKTVNDKTKDITKCPKDITLDMLLTEFDCEDLRSRHKKESIEKQELWDKYREVNYLLFPPRVLSEQTIKYKSLRDMVKPKI